MIWRGCVFEVRRRISSVMQCQGWSVVRDRWCGITPVYVAMWRQTFSFIKDDIAPISCSVLISAGPVNKNPTACYLFHLTLDLRCLIYTFCWLPSFWWHWRRLAKGTTKKAGDIGTHKIKICMTVYLHSTRRDLLLWRALWCYNIVRWKAYRRVHWGWHSAKFWWLVYNVRPQANALRWPHPSHHYHIARLQGDGFATNEGDNEAHQLIDGHFALGLLWWWQCDY